MPNDPLDMMQTIPPEEEGGGEPTLAEGTEFDKYRIVRLLGRGGMGVVYEVEHRVLTTHFAMKMLPAAMRSQPGFGVRFEQEARVMASLAHPNIVRVDDYGEKGDWLRMELADGVRLRGGKVAISLHELAAAHRGRLPPELLTAVMCQALEGLAFAHAAGAVHRDIKPANILLFGGDRARPVAKIADFGLVRLIGEDWVRSQAELSMTRGGMSMGDAPTMGGEDEAGTSTRSLLGTYDYMSPEQKRGEPAEKPSDVYAMGLILFRLLTGENSLGFELPSQLDDSLDPLWDEIVKRALSPRADQRFCDAGSMLKGMGIMRGDTESLLAAVADDDKEDEEYEEGEEDEAEGEEEEDAGEEEAQPGSFEDLEAVNTADYAPIQYEARTPTKFFGLAGGEAVTKALAQGSEEAQCRQRRAVEELDLPLEVCTVKTGIVMRLIPAGSFTMGSPEDELGRFDNEGQHRVTLSRPFYCGKFPVTQTQWQAVMGENAAHFDLVGGDAPVESVTWNDCQEFLAQLCELEEVPEGTYCLPTGAEREYACRAGASTALYNGDLTAEKGRCANLEDIAWYKANSDGWTHPVGEKTPNAWGLHDMLGNVYEWCFDWDGDYPSGHTTDPTGPEEGESRMNRGGGWNSTPPYCRAADRDGDDPGEETSDLGLRVVRII